MPQAVTTNISSGTSPAASTGKRARVPANLLGHEGLPPIDGELVAHGDGLRFSHSEGETEIPAARLQARCGGFNDSVLFLSDSQRPERIIACHTPRVWQPLAPEVPAVAAAMQQVAIRRRRFWWSLGGLAGLLALLAIGLATITWIVLSTLAGKLF